MFICVFTHSLSLIFVYFYCCDWRFNLSCDCQSTMLYMMVLHLFSLDWWREVALWHIPEVHSFGGKLKPCNVRFVLSFMFMIPFYPFLDGTWDTLTNLQQEMCCLYEANVFEWVTCNPKHVQAHNFIRIILYMPIWMSVYIMHKISHVKIGLSSQIRVWKYANQGISKGNLNITFHQLSKKINF